jgi:hypothetical protein
MDNTYFRLECENKAALSSPTVGQIERTILGLRSNGKHSFASITAPDGTYLQVAGGGTTCLLERFDAIAKLRCRAFTSRIHPVLPDGTILVFRAGKMPMRSDEWLMASEVVRAFCFFRAGEPLPESILWRRAPGF